jgi:hypothetical protein
LLEKHSISQNTNDKITQFVDDIKQKYHLNLYSKSNSAKKQFFLPSGVTHAISWKKNKNMFSTMLLEEDRGPRVSRLIQIILLALWQLKSSESMLKGQQFESIRFSMRLTLLIQLSLQTAEGVNNVFSLSASHRNSLHATIDNSAKNENMLSEN